MAFARRALGLLVLPTITGVAADAPQLPAFPGAEGAGRYTSGGRGGTVVHVTNLNAEGPGSLAEAVSGPDRIVVFDVSGIIDLAHKGKGGHIRVEHPNITIAGQTAPGEGICLRGGALEVIAGNVMVRYLRSRRGFVADRDSGDAIDVKPKSKGKKEDATGTTAEVFEKTKIKKLERGKTMQAFTDIDNILIDHCSASWATDENLTVTHAGLATISYCIAAEGLDYTNEKQTPPNHSEGGLWGSAAPDGRSTMHHVLFAHNRLRNPRTTAGAEVPPVLTLYNCVVYNWSEYPTHSGSERMLLQWLANAYVYGPDTPDDMRGIGFQFMGDPGARVFAQGNIILGSQAATQDNRLAISWGRKFKSTSLEQKNAMIVSEPFTELPEHEPAERAFVTVMTDAGATLPARDAVDARIVEHVQTRTGRVIGKETDLAPEKRWPDYRALPPLADSDGDGIPDFWETQFGLNPRDAKDATSLTAAGYANIECYFNNTDPRLHGGGEPIVYVAANISRASVTQQRTGEWRVCRATGDVSAPLTVHYRVSGDAAAGRDFAALGGEVTIPAGARSTLLALEPLATAADDRTVVVTLAESPRNYFVGCPSRSLVVIRR